VSVFRIREAADLLGVSDDTVRRWAENGRVTTVTDGSGRLSIEGAVLARVSGSVWVVVHVGRSDVSADSMWTAGLKNGCQLRCTAYLLK